MLPALLCSTYNSNSSLLFLQPGPSLFYDTTSLQTSHPHSQHGQNQEHHVSSPFRVSILRVSNLGTDHENRNPGKSKDDEVMYGSGQSSDPVHAGTGTQATSSHNTNNPLTSSTADMPSSTREPVGQGGIGSIQQGSNPTSSSRMPGMSDDDAGSALSIKSGQPGNSQQSKVTGLPDTHDPLNTNKALPREPTTGPTTGLGSSTASGAGPHSSALGNKVDPRVDSDLDGSRGIGGSGAAGMSSGMSSGMAGSNLADRTVGK